MVLLFRLVEKIKDYCIPANFLSTFLLRISAGTLTYYLSNVSFYS
jgi:hypothetical protein